MNSNIRAGSLFGIPFFINVSWFFVLVLTTLNFASGLANQFPELAGHALGLGLVSGLLLFASVLLHELGHSIAAQQQGITVHSITLFLFGGMARMDKDAKTAGGAFRIAIAGPLVSFALFLGLTAAVGSGLVTGAIAAIVGLLAYINLILATFNMIPGLPLDGGNVLKAIIWQVTGDRYRGIQWASRMGQLIAWAAIVTGLMSMLGLPSVGSFWTFILGVFLLQNANQASRAAAVEEMMAALPVEPRDRHHKIRTDRNVTKSAHRPITVNVASVDVLD